MNTEKCLNLNNEAIFKDCLVCPSNINARSLSDLLMRKSLECCHLNKEDNKV